jgi:hypothetical protein
LTNSSLYYQVNSFVFIPCSSSCCLFFSFFFYCCFIPDDIIIITRHFGNLLSVSLVAVQRHRNQFDELKRPTRNLPIHYL